MQLSLGERKLYTTKTIRKNRSPVWMETYRVYVVYCRYSPRSASFRS
jgi:hypothetical protein